MRPQKEHEKHLDAPCDLCRGPNRQPAKYDALTKMGVWAYLCEAHFYRCAVDRDGKVGL